MESSDPSLHTPEQKLRRISLGGFQLDEFPVILKKPCRQLNGWGNENWDLKTEEIISKSHSRCKSKSHSPQKKHNHKMKQTPPHNRTTKYIARIQQKLNELIEIRAQHPNSTQSIQRNHPYYLTSPRDQQHPRTMKSHTDCDKQQQHQHNFTYTMHDKKLSKDWHRSFNIRKTQDIIEKTQNKNTLDNTNAQNIHARSIYGKSVMLPQTQRNKIQLLGERVYQNKSTMGTYDDLVRLTGEVSMISYPLIDTQQKKPSKTPKLNKLHEFYQRFQSQQSKHQRTKYIGFSKNKRFRMTQNNKQQTVFNIKMTEKLQNKNRKSSLRKVQ